MLLLLLSVSLGGAGVVGCVAFSVVDDDDDDDNDDGRW